MAATLSFDFNSTTAPKLKLEWTQAGSVNNPTANKSITFSIPVYNLDNSTTTNFVSMTSGSLVTTSIQYWNGTTFINDGTLIANLSNTNNGLLTFTGTSGNLIVGRTYRILINFANSTNTFFNTSNKYLGRNVSSTLNTNAPSLAPKDTNNNPSNPIPQFFCLFEDTEVLTPSGYVSVKTLQEGDLVTTSDGRSSHIKRIWSSHMPLQQEFLPIIIPANSIAENYPPKDCRLSKWHLINFNGNWISPHKNEHIFKYDRDVKTIKYYHLELENYFTDHLVINGGLIVESLGNGKEDTGTEWTSRENNSIIL